MPSARGRRLSWFPAAISATAITSTPTTRPKNGSIGLEKDGTLGLDKNRLQLAWISAAEGNLFAKKMKEMDEIIKGVTPEEIEKTKQVLVPRKREKAKDQRGGTFVIKSIWELFNKEDLFECYQCARCTGSCPAAMVMKSYGPREILLRCLNLGQEPYSGMNGYGIVPPAMSAKTAAPRKSIFRNY